METAMRRARSGNLTAVLVAFAALELVINRVFSRLFAPGATTLSSPGSGGHDSRLMDSAGPLLFYLTAVLALGIFVAALTGLIRRGELYPRAIRFSVVVVALIFAGYSSVALVRGQMPPRHFLFLEIGFALLALFTAVGLASARAPARVRIGVALFALPGVLHAVAVVAASRSNEGLGPQLAVVLAGAGEVALVLAGITAPFALPPRPFGERRWRLPLATAATLTTGFIVALTLRFDLVQASVLYGLRIVDLPRPSSLVGVGHVAAFFGWTYATTQLITDKGGMRLAGYGLLLLAIGGYEAGSQLELSLSLLGLVALAVGELRAAPYSDRTEPRVPAAEWRAFVGRLRNAATDETAPDDTRPEAVVVEDGEVEISRIHTYRRGYSVSIKLRRRRGALVELDATVGTIGHALPDASIERHRRWLARSPEHRLKLARLKTGDPAFDQRFSVHGEAPLADEELRRRVARQQGDGVLTIWLGTAARYLLSHPSADAESLPVFPVFAGIVEGAAPLDSIVQLLDTLADLVEASVQTAS